MKRFALIAVLMALVGCAQGQVIPLATYTCYKAVDEVKLDGVLSEQSWKKAESTGNFQIFTGLELSPLKTTAKMVWDEEKLYIAFECEDPDLYSTFKNKDEALYNEDVVEVFVSEMSLNRDNFVEYEVSVLGTLFDCYLIVPYAGIMDWASPFEAGVKAVGTVNKPGDKDTGYTVEMAIPFTDFYVRKPWNKEDWKDLTPKDGGTIRLNLYRIDYSTPKELGKPGTKPVFITWSPTITGAFHRPHRFGILTFADWPVGKPRHQPAQ